MQHKKECQCAVCQNGVEAVQERQRANLDKYGWVAHFITDYDSSSPTGCNIHTHGLVENFNHPDLQVVLPIPHQVAHSILVSAIDLIREGVRFQAGQQYDKICGGYKVTFIQAIEGDRAVLRIILPTPNGSLDPLTMDPGENWQPYRDQFGRTVKIEERDDGFLPVKL